MALEKIGLNSLLAIFYSPENKQISSLRDDIRKEISKQAGFKSEGGGHFQVPFWSDAKAHVAGTLDLNTMTSARVGQNARRSRLYPELAIGFLKWWNEKRRWRNEPFEIIEKSIRGTVEFLELKSIVKVENILAFKMHDDSCKLVYPYFPEMPVLTQEAAQLALWAMGKALPNYEIADMRILDVLRGKSFAIIDCPLQGNEEALFVSKYKQLWKRRKELRKEYK